MQNTARQTRDNRTTTVDFRTKRPMSYSQKIKMPCGSSDLGTSAASSPLMTSNHFWRAAEIDEDVPLAFL